MNLFAILMLALAISLDGLIVGITYGLKEIKLNYLPVLIISLASGIMILISMSLGRFIAQFLAPVWAARLGGIMLMGIGSWLFYQSLHTLITEGSCKNETSPQEILSFKISSLGLIVNILKEPSAADMDYSGAISKQEALFLGIALALDAFGAGMGAAMIGYQPLLTAVLVAVCKLGLLTSGIYIGKNLVQSKISTKLKLLPGLILILLGLTKLL